MLQCLRLQTHLSIIIQEFIVKNNVEIDLQKQYGYNFFHNVSLKLQ